MDDEKKEAPLFSELLRKFATIFTMSVLAISFVGSLLARYAPAAQDISNMFVSGETGFPYVVILQISGFSLVVAAFSVVLISGRFIKGMRLWLRIFLLFLSALLTFSFFAVVFKWFPAEDPLAWLGFVLCTVVCFVLSLCLSLLKFRLEGRKYDKLLANYKARHKTKPP